MAIRIEMLRCFSLVAQAGNLGDAASRLNRTPSAVSMTLSQLEDNIGQRLFETDRKNRLTPIGEEIFALAQQQLRSFDETINAIETIASAPQGLLRIASIPSVAGLFLPAAIEELTNRHPGIRVELRDTDSAQVIESLVSGHTDLGVVSGEHVLNDVDQRVLFRDSYGLVAAPDHPLAIMQSAPNIDEVFAQGFVMNNLCEQIGSPEMTAAFSTARVSAQNTFSLIGMIKTGNWVTILPNTVVQTMPDELVFRKVKGLKERRTVSLLIRKRSRQFNLAEELYDIVRKMDLGQNAQ